MGFKDKMKQMKEDGTLYKFHPIDLNEGNVQAIFNRCLATREDDLDDVTSSVLFQRDFGYDEDSKPIFFHKGRLEQNRKNILYLLGQLKTVHVEDISISSGTSIYRYDDIKWTVDTATLMKFFHLGEVTGDVLPFVKRSNTATVNNTVKPTLSPKDPAFPAWWEQHRAEWEA